MAPFISTRLNDLSNGLIRPIRLSESTRYIRTHSSQITCIWLVNLRKRLLFYVTCICNVYKMSGRSVSVYTDTSALHEYLCALVQNGHEFCKLLIKRPQIVMFSNNIKKINVKNLENCEKSLCKSGPFCIIVYRL